MPQTDKGIDAICDAVKQLGARFDSMIERKEAARKDGDLEYIAMMESDLKKLEEQRRRLSVDGDKKELDDVVKIISIMKQAIRSERADAALDRKDKARQDGFGDALLDTVLSILEDPILAAGYAAALVIAGTWTYDKISDAISAISRALSSSSPTPDQERKMRRALGTLEKAREEKQKGKSRKDGNDIEMMEADLAALRAELRAAVSASDKAEIEDIKSSIAMVERAIANERDDAVGSGNILTGWWHERKANEELAASRERNLKERKTAQRAAAKEQTIMRPSTGRDGPSQSLLPGIQFDEAVGKICDEVQRMGERLDAMITARTGSRGDAAFKEGDHPRDKDGEFGSGGGKQKPSGSAGEHRAAEKEDFTRRREANRDKAIQETYRTPAAEPEKKPGAIKRFMNKYEFGGSGTGLLTGGLSSAMKGDIMGAFTGGMVTRREDAIRAIADGVAKLGARMDAICDARAKADAYEDRMWVVESKLPNDPRWYHEGWFESEARASARAVAVKVEEPALATRILPPNTTYAPR